MIWDNIIKELSRYTTVPGQLQLSQDCPVSRDRARLLSQDRLHRLGTYSGHSCRELYQDVSVPGRLQLTWDRPARTCPGTELSQDRTWRS